MEIESPNNISLGSRKSLVINTLFTLQMLPLCFILLNIFSINDLDSLYNIFFFFL